MTISATKVHTLSTSKLEAERDRAESQGNWDLFEACEEELERREDAESDPAYLADRQDAEDADAPVQYAAGLALEGLGDYGA